MKIHEKIQTLLPKGVRAYLVGGCVRDLLLGITPKDFDIEVFGVTVNELEEILSPHGKVSTVGKSFGVIKFHDYESGEDFDFSLPRKDNKFGVGHKGFRVEIDSSLSIEEAARRRDYTINAMSIDIWSGNLIDPYNGRKDLKRKILRHISHEFSEDPLRVLRGFQFAGRYDLYLDRKTRNLCRDLFDEFHYLSKERIWGEFEKWATKSMVPSKGLKFLIESKWIKHFPEIEELIGCPQDLEWHPEGDVFTHTCQVIDYAARSNLIVIFASLCHDFGKPETTTTIDGRIRTRGHAQEGLVKVRSFLKRIGCPRDHIIPIENIVSEHLVHLQTINYRTVRRLILRLGEASIDDLVSLIASDHAGRGSASARLPDSAIEISDIAVEIGNEIKPIVTGKHLIELGLEPGPIFGTILKSALEAQIDEKFETIEGGIEFLKTEKLI